jgi:hypothetical protein
MPIEGVAASGSSLNTPGETQTANQVAPLTFPKGIDTGNPWFSITSFTQSTGVVFGNTGRNPFNGPGLFALNASLFKNIRIERYNIEVRGEAFNITNTPEFGTSIPATAGCPVCVSQFEPNKRFWDRIFWCRPCEAGAMAKLVFHP